MLGEWYEAMRHSGCRILVDLVVEHSGITVVVGGLEWWLKQVMIV